MNQVKVILSLDDDIVFSPQGTKVLLDWIDTIELRSDGSLRGIGWHEPPGYGGFEGKLNWPKLGLLELLDDDDLAKRVAVDCHDPHHDDRWCPTCEARRDGIEAYQRALREVLRLQAAQ